MNFGKSSTLCGDLLNTEKIIRKKFSENEEEWSMVDKGLD